MDSISDNTPHPLAEAEERYHRTLQNLFCFNQTASAIPPGDSKPDATASRPGYLASATGLRGYLDLRADPLL
ncbi:hypothetical protein SAMN05216317_1261 [Nitrosomonas eutropha]|nr:hypothetical protein SAMN05216317_1261 [Nitrosomonas eutropha]